MIDERFARNAAIIEQMKARQAQSTPEAHLEQLRALAEGAARMTGAVDHLTSWIKTVNGDIVAAHPEGPLRHSVWSLGSPGGEPVRYEARITTPRPYERRTVSRAKLKAKFPFAYTAAVTEAPPEKPYQVRLDNAKPGQRSVVWAQVKDDAARLWDIELRKRYAGLAWTLPTQLKAVHEMRAEVRELRARLEARKTEIGLYITDHDMALTCEFRGDARITLRESPLKTTVDFEMLERFYPAAAKLITRTSVTPTARVLFTEHGKAYDPEDDEDPFEGY